MKRVLEKLTKEETIVVLGAFVFATFATFLLAAILFLCGVLH